MPPGPPVKRVLRGAGVSLAPPHTTLQSLFRAQGQQAVGGLGLLCWGIQSTTRRNRAHVQVKLVESRGEAGSYQKMSSGSNDISGPANKFLSQHSLCKQQHIMGSSIYYK